MGSEGIPPLFVMYCSLCALVPHQGDINCHMTRKRSSILHSIKVSVHTSQWNRSFAQFRETGDYD